MCDEVEAHRVLRAVILGAVGAKGGIWSKEALLQSSTELGWDYLITEAQLQRIEPFVTERLWRDGLMSLLPDRIRETLEQQFVDNAIHNAVYTNELCRINCKLDEAGVDSVLLKGLSSVDRYAGLAFRRVGDIDLLIKDQEFASAHAALTDLGYGQYIWDPRKREWVDTPQEVVRFRRQVSRHAPTYFRESSIHLYDLYDSTLSLVRSEIKASHIPSHVAELLESRAFEAARTARQYFVELHYQVSYPGSPYAYDDIGMVNRGERFALSNGAECKKLEISDEIVFLADHFWREACLYHNIAKRNDVSILKCIDFAMAWDDFVAATQHLDTNEVWTRLRCDVPFYYCVSMVDRLFELRDLTRILGGATAPDGFHVGTDGSPFFEWESDFVSRLFCRDRALMARRVFYAKVGHRQSLVCSRMKDSETDWRAIPSLAASCESVSPNQEYGTHLEFYFGGRKPGAFSVSSVHSLDSLHVRFVMSGEIVLGPQDPIGFLMNRDVLWLRFCAAPYDRVVDVIVYPTEPSLTGDTWVSLVNGEESEEVAVQVCQDENGKTAVLIEMLGHLLGEEFPPTEQVPFDARFLTCDPELGYTNAALVWAGGDMGNLPQGGLRFEDQAI